MQLYASYQDDRDAWADESAIIEGDDLDAVVLGVYTYFARVPESWTHCVEWIIREGVNGRIVRQEHGPAERKARK